VAYDEELANRIRECLAAGPHHTEKRMFGGLAFLINGHLAVSASRQGGVMVRVEPAETEALLGEAHAAPFVMRGRELDGRCRWPADR
jgi:TfoX-like protein